ncbi:MAG: DUF6526 family protein [Edaphobacter sp.]
MMTAPQNLRNHIRLDPPFHFVLMPVLILDFFFSIYVTIAHWPIHRALSGWWIVMSLAFILLAIRGRQFALKAQDRIIRLEERLRLASLLPAAELVHINELTTRQLISLRFASDAELPALVHLTLTQNLDPKAIKRSIVNWRPDNERV